MKKLSVNINSQNQNFYQIAIGEKLLEKINTIINLSKYTKIAIITDINLKTQLNRLIKHIPESVTITLSSGEKHKNISQVGQIWTKLVESEFDRRSLIINLGGGVITDIGGFVASTYMRGIDFINIPTTLLSQVDASIGGKSGINFADVKNLIGTFNQPKLVVIDTKTLDTLPNREFNAGFGEIFKHGLIQDAKYFKLVTSKKPKNFSRSELTDIILKSVMIKKSIVENDVNEKGRRKLLNFGHTIGHAIEVLSLKSSDPQLHGEAISVGMMMEAKISQFLGLIEKDDLNVIENALKNAGLPTKTDISHNKIMEKIKIDKKNENNTLNFTLLHAIGKASINHEPSKDIIIKALESTTN